MVGREIQHYACLVNLTKVQRNELFSAIVAGGVDPLDCRLDDLDQDHRSNTQRACVTHLSSDSRFRFERVNQIGEYEIREGGRGPQKRLSWQNILDNVTAWAQEITQPDFWIDLPHKPNLLLEALYEDLRNAPFTIDEQTQVTRQLSEIKEYVKKTYSLSGEQVSRVEAGFDEVDRASRRIGRKDWLLLFNGALFSLILTDILPSQAVQQILIIALHGMSHLFGMGEPPPQLP
jgi:hypothetical protein